MQLPVRRILSFSGLQLVAAVAPVAVLPVLVRRIGVDGWVGLSVGYGIGAAAAVAVTLGWAVTGPPLVAGVAPATARAFYVESLLTRCAALAAVFMVVVPVTSFLAPDGSRVLACAMAVGVGTWGLTPTWYFIGRGAPSGILTCETTPRLVATLVSIPGVAIVGPVVYPALLVVATLVGLARAELLTRRHSERRGGLQPGVRRRLRSNIMVAASGVIGAGYSSLAIPIVSVTAAPLTQVSDLAGSLRIRALSQAGVSALTAAYQGWVAEPETYDARRLRAKSAARSTVLGGTVTAIGLFAAAPLLDTLLFGEVVQISWALSAVTAFTVIPFAVGSTLSFHVLAPMGRADVIVWSRIAATVVGAPGLYVMAQLYGAVGAAGAVLLSECVVAAWQALAVRREHSRRRP